MELEELQKHLDADPASPLVARLALAYLDRGDKKKAKELCLASVQQYPSYPTSHYVLAKCYAADSQFNEALQSLNPAIKLFPDSRLLVTLQAEWEQKKPVVTAPPPAPVADLPIEQPVVEGEIVSQTLAEIYVKQGLFEQAIQSYRQLIQRKPAQAKEFEKRIGEIEKKLLNK